MSNFINHIKNNTFTYLFRKGLWSLKQNGTRITYLKFKDLIRRKIAAYKNINYYSQLGSYPGLNINDVPPLHNFNKKIAVHLHLYYTDLSDEFISYLDHIPFSFDLFISTRENENIPKIISAFQKIKNVQKIDVRPTINKGRDIAPLYALFGNEIKRYDYILHIHSKKSLYTGKEQNNWRQYSLDCLLESNELIKKIFALFEDKEKKIGLFYPETFKGMPLMAHDWLKNKKEGKEFLSSLGIPFEEGLFNYPVGSFFWAKTDAIRPLFEKQLTYDDFPEEAGQTDGTLAHVLERAIAFIIKSKGYQSAIYDINTQQISLGSSLKFYNNYFLTNANLAFDTLKNFELISFDIFDTLITRKVLLPDDVFHLMEKKIKKQYGYTIDFIKLRKQAELLAWEEKRAYCSLDDIYKKLPLVWNIPKNIAESIKQIEIETELEVCIPRNDMLEIFNKLKNVGKKIVLVSDMYLPSHIIEKILTKCGYSGYDELWISCEIGARKDDDTLWSIFFEKYKNYYTIHVGDNTRSDIQTVCDRQKPSFYVMNPFTSFKLSKLYGKLEQYVNTTVENSILLGMLINGKLFNSPFSQGLDGEPQITDTEELGYIAFAPLFTQFINWLDEKSKGEDVLLFLSREGYLFQKIYDIYCNIMQKQNRAIYFLASRRATSVPTIKNKEDIKSILETQYDGTLSNLLQSRLGISLPDEIPDTNIKMGKNLETVLNLLNPYEKNIFSTAQQEKETYLKYINNLFDHSPDKKIAVVDVGYMGTIQYYLMKLLNCNITGYYLSTYLYTKPEIINGKCVSLYPLSDSNDRLARKISNKTLFLETALQAPYGQLIKFNNVNGKIIPEYKSDDQLKSEILDLQNGILNFAKEYFELLSSFDSYTLNKDLPAQVFDILLDEQWLNDKLSDIFTVQDDYCSNGLYVFDTKEKKWKLE